MSYNSLDKNKVFYQHHTELFLFKMVQQLSLNFDAEKNHLSLPNHKKINTNLSNERFCCNSVWWWSGSGH